MASSFSPFLSPPAKRPLNYSTITLDSSLNSTNGYFANKRSKTQTSTSAAPSTVPSGHVWFRLLCHESRIGGVIGKGGNIIKGLQQQTGAKIRIEDAPLESLDRVITIVGSVTQSAVLFGGNESSIEVSKGQEALVRVFERILEVGVESDSVAGGVVSCRLLAEMSSIGAVIGKGGKIVEKIKKDCGCKVKILIDKLHACASSNEEMIEIEGNASAVKKGLVAVSRRLQDCQPVDKTRVISSKPVEAVSRVSLPEVGVEILPQQSAVLPTIGQHSVAPPAVAKSSIDYSSRAHLFLSGSERVSTLDTSTPQQPVVFRILCNNDRVGGVIGRGGNIVTAIQNETGAAISIGPKVAECNERLITVTASEEVSRLLIGLNCGKPLELIALPEAAKALSSKHDFDLQAFSFDADKELLREPQVVRVGLIQNSVALPTTAPLLDQKKAIFQKLKPIIDSAGASGVNILCLQEAWMMPFAFCTREKRWCEFAEPVDGESTRFLQEYARKYNMVIISPILERDVNHGETLWNTAIIIGNHGNIIGKHRKNHIPRVGDFNESTYYMEGNTDHPVFKTAYGKIAVNICYGRHHPMNWLAFGLNGAEIVFNPSATVGELSEPMWPIEARNAAIANSYFVGSINRVGTETFPNPFTSGDGKPQHADFGHFYGSSHFSAPDASCTPSLSRYKDGLLISDMDLNLCRQLKDKWGFRMTARYELYADLLARYLKPEFEPQVISDPLLHKKSL